MTQQRLTPPGTLVGTADYLAPEVIAGQAVDGRADLYSLGVVLYEMLCGHVPFAGRDPLQTLRAHLEEPLPELPAEIGEPVRRVAAKALEKDPNHRFASATELAAALAAVSS
jgi:serine/threonine protein kinase